MVGRIWEDAPEKVWDGTRWRAVLSKIDPQVYQPPSEQISTDRSTLEEWAAGVDALIQEMIHDQG